MLDGVRALEHSMQLREIAGAMLSTKGRFFGVGFEPRSDKPFRMMNAHDVKTSAKMLRRLREDARAFLLSVYDINILQNGEQPVRRVPFEGIRYFRCGNVCIDIRTEAQKALHPKVKGLQG